MTSYISPSITDPALRDTLQSITDDVEASGITISDVDPDASLTARSGRLWYNATSSNLFIFSDAQGGYVRATGEEKNYHAVRIYWPNSASVYPASPPQVTLTWANLTAASAGARYTGGLTLPTVSGTAWQEDPPNALSTGQTNIWWSDVIFQRISGSDTTVSTGTTPQKHTNFNGMVTFSKLSTFDPNDTTVIHGNNITTGSINFNRITGVSISADDITAGTLTAGLISATSIDVETIESGNFKPDSISAIASLIGGSTGGFNNQQYTQFGTTVSGDTGDPSPWSAFSSALQITGSGSVGGSSGLTSSGLGSGAGAKIQLSAYVPTIYSGHSSGGLTLSIVVGATQNSTTTVASFFFGVGGSGSGPRTGGPCFLSGSIDASSLTGTQNAYLKINGTNVPSGGTAYARFMYLQAMMIKA